MDKKQPVIEFQQVSFAYPGSRQVLDNLDFIFCEGDRIGLLAPNGSGKTTFFHVIMGLLKPQAGVIKIFGQPMKNEKDYIRVRRRVGLLFQDADDQLFCPTVLEDVAFGPLNMGRSKAEALAVSRDTLGFLGLTGYEKKVTFQLSGGEKRLVALASVLSMKPEVLLLDEPLTGLDIKTQQVIKNLLPGLGLSYIIISHDLDFLTTTTESIYTLDAGKIKLDDRPHYHHHEHAHLLGNRPHRHDPHD